MKWLEKLLSLPDDPLPNCADVVIGVGIDLSTDGIEASPYSRAVALKTLHLYQSGRARNSLFTGGYTHGLIPLTESRALCDIVAWHVPWENIWLEQESSRTYLNADYSLKIIQEQKWSKVIIIAQQWHARRVRATFKKRWAGQGIEFHVVKAWSNYGGGSQRRLNHFFTFVLWDTLAFIVSKFKGWC